MTSTTSTDHADSPPAGGSQPGRTFTTPLADSASTDPTVTGGKGANLAVMTRAGLPVPAGFVVTTSAYDEFVHAHCLGGVIDRELERLAADPGAVDTVSDRLRRAFAEAGMPDALRAEISAAYQLLGAPAVAVRSSATAEDLPQASFAGQQNTVLNVEGAQALCDAVKRCWSSLWTVRALTYRARNDIGNRGLSVAVVVQEMVPADVAGVMFTADPLSGRRDRMVIEAAAGLGEAVVSGHVTPARWLVDTRGGPVPEAVGGAGQLDRSLVDALTELGTRTADLFGVPQDIEWAVSNGRCWLLQSRPITSLFPLPPPSPSPGLRVYIPAVLVSQGIAEPLTPAGNAFFATLTTGWIRYLAMGSGLRVDQLPPWLPTLAGRLFIDATPLLQHPRLADRVVANLSMKEPTGGAALREWLSANADRLPQSRRRFPLRGALRWGPGLLVRLLLALLAPARSRRRVLAATDAELDRLDREATALTDPARLLEFVYRDLPARTCALVVQQLPAAYAEQVIRIVTERLVTRWLGADADFEPIRRWLPHDPTVAMGRALARIARDAAASGTDITPTSPALETFLATYGHRAPDREIDMGLERFADDPAYVVDLIAGYARSGGEVLERMRTGTAQSAAAADRLASNVRRDRGRVRAAVLRRLLDRHRELGGLREQPKFDMVRAIALAHRSLRRVGTALVDGGSLDDPGDAFFCGPADIRAALCGHRRDLRPTAAANRRAYDRELDRRAVPRILVNDGETIYGPTEPAGSGQADVLVGTSISPGIHEGVVRVLDSSVGARLEPGEILVAASTDPGWTPLFLLAGALVMEVGGVISHGAVVAREYGIPAVGAVTGATTRLRTGQRVVVDGNRGTVTLLETPAS
ncbi:PEP/pyruvate-binding domain-containing protein [Mycobacterium sp. B14F4]|uniref:PEP/pyruvate-binding domain-containing protein n=1 Tax=Mycobacterium sp. B14F4 TaxID=3153565 RepID=UPI00325C3ACE